MAPTFIFTIAGQILAKLSSPIIEELSLAWGFKDNLRRLKNTISSVHALLLDAQEKQLRSNQLRDWLEKLENALYHAEDVLEEFEIDALRYKVSSQSILRKVRREFSLSNRIVFRFKMAHKIQKVREEFDEISLDRNRFGLIERPDDRVIVHREITHSFVREEDVIGRDKEREKVISFLMATSNRENVSVLPIIGIGGMGKTTLAKLVHNDTRVVEIFDLRIWVCVSKEFELDGLTREILKSVKGTGYDNLGLEQLQQLLRAELKDKRYLLILDDVWNENRVKWINMKNLLIGGANGSKIVVTTRNQLVASIMTVNDSTSINLEGLSHRECLSIFLKWAFSSSEDAHKYPRLNDIAGDIVRKCKGVPLAVRTLGSLLYKKTEEGEWIKVRDNDIWKMEQSEDGILPALMLSYYQLPTNLRRCFLFSSLYPKDTTFSSTKMTHIWQANGMLQKIGDNQEMVDVAIMYIKQLLSRGFFQEFEDYKSHATFKMHDLVHDLALLVGQRDFINVHSQTFSHHLSYRFARHVSFPENYFSTKDIPNWLLEQKESVRTITFPDGAGDSKDSFFLTCISEFKSLRMLRLSNSSFQVLPSSIGCMKHLKYLNLSNNSRFKSLPASICNLVGLEVLDFSRCLNIEKLPKGLGKLIRLKELGISTNETCMPDDELRCLTSLQRLIISDCPNLRYVMSNDTMQRFSALRHLLVRKCRNLVSLPLRGMGHLTRLEYLFVGACKNLNQKLGHELDDDRATNSIRGEDVSFQNLHRLDLFNLPKLEILPSWLLQAANNLENIYIEECKNLTYLMPEEEVGLIKSLQKLAIDNCPKLVGLPEGIRNLTALQVEIENCPQLVRWGSRWKGLAQDLPSWFSISSSPMATTSQAAWFQKIRPDPEPSFFTQAGFFLFFFLFFFCGYFMFCNNKLFVQPFL